MAGDDPPTRPSTIGEAIRARLSRPEPMPATTLPPPSGDRRPASPSGGAGVHDQVTREQTVMPRAAIDDVVLLDMVSRHAPATPARSEMTSGSLVVVATGADADRIRLLCQGASLHVAIVATPSLVHDAASVVVIGEPSPPAPERIRYVARPTLSDDMIGALLRSLAAGRVVADPPSTGSSTDPRLRAHADRIAAEPDRAAIEELGAAAIVEVTNADRAQLLFHDPATGAVWSEAKQRAGGDTRRAAFGVVGWCAHTGHAVLASPAGDDPRYVLDLDDPDGKPQARVLVQPVIGADLRVHALLVAARRWRRTDFTADDRAALRDLAALIATAIDIAAGKAPKRSSRPTLPGVAASLAAAAAGAASGPDPSPASTLQLPQQGLAPAAPTHVASPSPASTSAGPQHGGAAHAPAHDDSLSPASTLALPQQLKAPASDSGGARPRTTTGAGHVAGTTAAGAQPAHHSAGSTAAGATPAPPIVSTPPPSASQSMPVQTSPTMRSLPPMPAQPARRATIDPPSRSRSISEAPRAKRPSVDGSEPRDLAVVATDAADVARVGKLAKKARLEISVLGSTDEVPAYYRIVTLGLPWTPEVDPRVTYAARTAVTDEHLVELLAGLARDRAQDPIVPARPSTVAEARRLHPLFERLRAIVAAADLAAAETTLVAAVKQLLDADRAYCLFYDGADGSLWSERRERDGGDDRRAIAGIIGWVARTGRAANIERASADPRWLAPLDDPDGDPNSQLMLQPIITADRRVIGVLVAARRPKRAGFGDTDVALLAQISALAAPLLEQLELADDCAQLLSDSSVPVEVPTAPALGARLAALPRWLYAVGGAALAGAVFAIASC
jgi:GAF domain-containing protein